MRTMPPARPDDLAVLRVDTEVLNRGPSPDWSTDSIPALRVVTSRHRSSRWRTLVTVPARSTALLYLAESSVLLGYVALETRHWRLLLCLWLLTIVIFRARGLYRPRLTLSVLDDL